MGHKNRLDKLEKELDPRRKLYQVKYVASSEEARRISEEEGYEPWRPGDGIRFIIDESLADWRRKYEAIQKPT